jgi:hypothetical protein
VPLRRSAPLPRGRPPQRRVPLRKKRSRPRRGPDRCPEYLAWIRTLACVVCSRMSCGATVIEAAHTHALGRRGMGQETSDFSAIPLCTAHHRENPDSYHRLGEQKFAHQHGIGLKNLVLALQIRFSQRELSDRDLALLADSTSPNLSLSPEGTSRENRRGAGDCGALLRLTYNVNSDTLNI